MRALEAHEDGMFRRLLGGLQELPRVRLFGQPARRTPTAYFTIEGREDREVSERLAAARVNAPASSFYALEASRRLGLGDTGALRAGLAPYTNAEDVDRLLAGIAAARGTTARTRSS
jgi:selenocysteine lyase/cysteine desulfurase